MRRLTWLLVLVMLLMCAHAEFDADIRTGDDGTELLIRLYNDTDEVISGARVVCGSTRITLPDIMPGEVYSASTAIKLPDSGKADVSVEYPAKTEKVTLPVDYSGVKLYVTLPDRALTSGESVPVRVTLSNEGKSEIQNVTVSTSNGFKSDLLELQPGEYRTFVTSAEVEFPFSFSAEAKHGKKVIVSKTADSPEQLRNDVALICVADSRVQAGQDINVTVSIDNRGNTNYTSPRITEAHSGDMTGLPAIIKAGSFITLYASMPCMNETGDLVFTFEGRSDDGVIYSQEGLPCHVEVEGETAPGEQRTLNAESKGKTSFVAEALLGIATLRGLTLIAVYVCTGVSVALLIAIIVRNMRRRKKR